MFIGLASTRTRSDRVVRARKLKPDGEDAAPDDSITTDDN